MTASVCIGVATYNNAKHIRECLDSILSQDAERLTVVISDDVSSDGTQEIVREYANRHPDTIRAFFNVENVGVSGNMNRILQYMDGDYHCYLPGDDVMYPGRIRKSIDFLENNADVGLCYHDCELFLDGSGILLNLYSERFPMRAGNLMDYVLGKSYFSFNTVTLRRETLPCPPFFDPDMGPYSDWEFLARAIAQAQAKGYARPVAFLSDVLVGYRRHEGNLSNRQDRAVLDLQAVGFAKLAKAYPEVAEACAAVLQERKLVQALRKSQGITERLRLLREASSHPEAWAMAMRTIANVLRAHFWARLRNRILGRTRRY